jgi:hypothetical protein
MEQAAHDIQWWALVLELFVNSCSACSVYSCYGNGCEIGRYTTTVSEQRLGKHVPVTTNTHATVDLQLETVCFLCGPCRDVMSRTV